MRNESEELSANGTKVYGNKQDMYSVKRTQLPASGQLYVQILCLTILGNQSSR